MAIKRPGALPESMLVTILRQVGDHHGGDEAEAAMSTRSLVSSHLTRVVVPQPRPRVSLRAERELKTLASALDGLARGRVQEVGDTLSQRFRAAEAAAWEEGGWAVARHPEVLPGVRPLCTSSGMRAGMVQAEKDCQRIRDGLRRGREGDRHQWHPPPRPPGQPPASVADGLPSALGGKEDRPPWAERGRGKGGKGKGKKGHR